ncbi:SGNH/GDSL hydrolase family protein [Limosilactobacillus caecicola]|uniref:SGNH/GDSL hydrolase family protein n=1 Tax=Limosilactobacillus caecicola TaxID=2941332 RepID=UPI00203C53E1|nr:SGNH/GDSL hydrolase family protein [Limosilactobacillus caecicola]
MKKAVRWLLVLIVILCCAGGAWYGYQHWGGSSSTANHQPTRVLKKKVRLVAIGDSLTYGQGDEDKKGGYVSLIKSRLQNKFHNQVTTVNYGVSGDRSDQILKRINQQSQIRKDLKHADVIVMTVGGNDLMQTFQKDLTTNSTKTLSKDINRAGKTYQTKLKKLFKTIRQENSTAPIFVMSIYNPVYTYFPQVENINNSISKWNQLTKQTLASYGPSYFVDINHLMSYGQYKTAAQRRKLIRSSEKANDGQTSQKELISIMNQRNKNLNKYISTDDNFHPNHLGYQQMTRKLYRVMLKHDSFEYQKR